MKARRIFRANRKTAEERAREQTLREKLQKDKPSLEDLVRGETVTRMLLAERGRRLRYFRHPFLFTGETPEYKKGLADFLAARGYTVAPVTVDDNDYVFADVYYKAKKRGDAETARRVAAAYVPYMEGVFDFFLTASRPWRTSWLIVGMVLHQLEQRQNPNFITGRPCTVNHLANAPSRPPRPTRRPRPRSARPGAV